MHAHTHTHTWLHTFAHAPSHTHTHTHAQAHTHSHSQVQINPNHTHTTINKQNKRSINKSRKKWVQFTAHPYVSGDVHGYGEAWQFHLKPKCLSNLVLIKQVFGYLYNNGHGTWWCTALCNDACMPKYTFLQPVSLCLTQPCSIWDVGVCGCDSVYMFDFCTCTCTPPPPPPPNHVLCKVLSAF